MENTPQDRIVWLDDLKGFGIFLIVLGHVVATLMSMLGGATRSVLHSLFDCIYAFHVPLFFFIAGLTLARRVQGFAPFLRKKFLRLVVPYLFWGLLCAALYVLVGGSMVNQLEATSTGGHFARKALAVSSWWTPFLSILHAGGWPQGRGFSFNGALWFLPALFSAEMIFWPAGRWLRTSGAAAAAVVLALVASVFAVPLYCQSLPWGVSMALRNLPYLALGHWFGISFLWGAAQCSDVRPARGGYLLLAGAVGVFSALALFCAPGFRDWSYVMDLAARALAGIVLWSALSMSGALRVFSRYAEQTLGIMIFHKFPLVLAQLVLARGCVVREFSGVGAIVCAVLLGGVLTELCQWGSVAAMRLLPWSLGVFSEKNLAQRGMCR